MFLLIFIAQFISNHAKSISLYEFPDTACPTSGKKCQQKAGELFSSDSKVPSFHNEITDTDEILLQLRQLGEKMDCMDKRMQHTHSVYFPGYCWTSYGLRF